MDVTASWGMWMQAALTDALPMPGRQSASAPAFVAPPRRALTATVLVVAAASILSGCSSTQPLAPRDGLSGMYGPANGGIRLQARTYHHDTAHSTLYFSLPTSDLLYKSSGDGAPFRAAATVRYEVHADWSSRVVLDSASIRVTDETTDPGMEQRLIGSMTLRSTLPAACVLKIQVNDLNRESQGVVYLRSLRGADRGAQYFLPIDVRTGQPLFSDHVKPGRALQVRCERLAGRTLAAGHRTADRSLPAPVFSSSTRTNGAEGTDSTFSVAVDSAGYFRFTPTAPGMYHFHQDDSTGTGYTAMVMGESYPTITTAADMLRPMRYITSVQEYDRMVNASNVREAVERFWIDAAGDRERAREAIRIYFERVETANRHFSGEVEGWRTDRGMVHIIFGKPTSIRKSESSETWTYGEENNLMSLVFMFVKRDSPYSDNELILERDPLLKGAWYRNVESWRNGRIYSN
jgi:GWxTD domain-containing protein